VFNILGLRGNYLAADDTEILRIKKQQLLKMSEDEISPNQVVMFIQTLFLF
jgi:hypothetical protein